MRQQFHALLPGRVQVVGFEIQRLLGHADGQRAVALHGLAPLQRFLDQIFLRDALVDQADLHCFLGTEAPRAENHLPRQAFADDARDVLRRAHGRARAHLGTGLTEHRVFGGNHQVAPQREFMSTTHAPAVDHGDHRDRQAANGHRQSEHAVVPHIGVGEIEPLHREEITAG